jgi:hypothetical protein
LFALATIMCFNTGKSQLAIVYGSVNILNVVIAYLFSQDY